MAGNTVYVSGNYVDVHDNKVVNLSIDKAGVVKLDKNKVSGEEDSEAVAEGAAEAAVAADDAVCTADDAVCTDDDAACTDDDVMNDVAGANVTIALESLPVLLQTYVLDRQRFPLMVRALNVRIVPFAHRQPNKLVWDAVRFVFRLHGLTPRLSREKFASLVLAVCPRMTETPRSLALSMAKSGFDHAKSAADYARLPQTNELKRLGSIIEGMLEEE